jgi:hypothetical protein
LTNKKSTDQVIARRSHHDIDLLLKSPPVSR